MRSRTLKSKLIYAAILITAIANLSGCKNDLDKKPEIEDITSEFEEQSTESEEAENNSSEDITFTGNVIKPYSVEKELNSLDNGVYNVSFDKDKGLSENAELSVIVYDYDKYSIEDIKNVQLGDKIIVDNYDYYVGSIDCSDIDYIGEDYFGYNDDMTIKEIPEELKDDFIPSTIDINGPFDEGGITLYYDNEKHHYRTITFDIYPLFYQVGDLKVKLSENCEFVDYAWDENYNTDNPKIYTNDKIGEGFCELEYGNFWAGNTTITVENGEIVNITRIWTP